MADVELRPARLDEPAAHVLIAAVQQEYVERYGGVDETVLDPAEFLPPAGAFFVGYLDDEPVVCGGWRRLDAFAGTGEIKRMYVVPAHRRQGLARLVLQRIEDSMRAAGIEQVWLETGEHQPEALALYAAAGYAAIDGYGHYKDAPLARPMGKRLSA